MPLLFEPEGAPPAVSDFVSQAFIDSRLLPREEEDSVSDLLLSTKYIASNGAGPCCLQSTALFGAHNWTAAGFEDTLPRGMLKQLAADVHAMDA